MCLISPRLTICTQLSPSMQYMPYLPITVPSLENTPFPPVSLKAAPALNWQYSVQTILLSQATNRPHSQPTKPMLNYAGEKRKKIVKSALKCVEFTFLRLTIEIALYLLIQPAWAIGFVQRNFHWYCYGRLHLTGQTLLSPSKSSHPINISVRYQRIHHTTNRVFIFKYMLIPNYTQI